MIGLLILVGLVVAATGPAGREAIGARLERRRVKRDRPLARVIYMPGTACRSGGPEPACTCPCAICQAR